MSVHDELKTLAFIESVFNNEQQEDHLVDFTEHVKELDDPIEFDAKYITVIENSIEGKKALCIDACDIVRYMTATEKTLNRDEPETQDVRKAFEDICNSNGILDHEEYEYVVTIPKSLDVAIKETANDEIVERYTMNPTKLVGLGRFTKFLKQACINQGIVVAASK